MLSSDRAEVWTLFDPEIRELFTRESLLASDWYRERLETQRALDIARWANHRNALRKFMADGLPAPQIDLDARLATTEEHLKRAECADYVALLVGTIGADPSFSAPLPQQ